MGDVTTELAELRAERDRLAGTWEFAFAMAHGCTWGNDPRLEPVRERYRALCARIAELTARR